MLAFKTLFHLFAAIYRLIIVSWNACFALHQVVQLVIQEAKREAGELMASLDDGVPALSSLFYDTDTPASPWQMLVIARESTFVLLLRLSKLRVLCLEVDENFIIPKLDVICTELMLHIQHIPHMLRSPIETHDTRLVKYTPIKFPYLWKETQVEARCKTTVSTAVAPADSTAGVNADAEGRAHRKKYVQLLTESAMRRRFHMDRLFAASELTPKRDLGVSKTQGVNVVKRKALENATNVTGPHPEGSAGVEETLDDGKTTVTDAVKVARVRAGLSENLSISNLAQAATLRKAAESLSSQQPRRMQSLRRKRGQFDLYAQGVSSEFSLLSKMGQGSD
ncbi:hypothetical protein JVU11DRAFT_10201 [Chiua virens]|nr:hypothetical protein JVU11DRAFT_10201 [Chiua virens]